MLCEIIYKEVSSKVQLLQTIFLSQIKVGSIVALQLYLKCLIKILRWLILQKNTLKSYPDLYKDKKILHNHWSNAGKAQDTLIILKVMGHLKKDHFPFI